MAPVFLTLPEQGSFHVLAIGQSGHIIFFYSTILRHHNLRGT